MKKPCPHGAFLPRGLRCDRGYLVIRLFTDKGEYFRGCGLHTPELQKIAVIALNRIREQQHLGTFGLPQKARRMRFQDAAKIFHQKHFVEWRHPTTNKPRSVASIANNQSHLNTLGSFFGDYWLEGLTLKDLKQYRNKRIEFDDIAGATVNRDLAVLSSMLTCLERWIAEGELEPILLPAKNPCPMLPDIQEVPRDRVASLDELKRLKASCLELNDAPLWSVIETEIDTSLRLNDLKRLDSMPIKDGQISMTQSKTGTRINFPASAKPNWGKVFVNFYKRWLAVRERAGIPDLQFRDLRKTGLRLLEDQFTPEDLASKAGHSDVKVTKKWYLSGRQAEQIRPMIAATRLLLENL